MASVFTRIISGELPGTFVHTDEVCVAFMTINPIARGHLLVVPRVEIDQWTDLPNDISQHCFAVAKRIGEAQSRFSIVIVLPLSSLDSKCHIVTCMSFQL